MMAVIEKELEKTIKILLRRGKGVCFNIHEGQQNIKYCVYNTTEKEIWN